MDIDDIYLAGKNAAYDIAAKKLLASRKILAWILKYCVEEFKESEIADIRDRYIIGTPEVALTPVLPDQTNAVSHIRGESTEDATLTEGRVTFDIRFRAVTPEEDPLELIINVEAQRSSHLTYPLMKRAVYYCSRLISSQYTVDFEKAKETLIKSLSDFILGYSCNARNYSTRIASYLRRIMTKQCMNIHTKSDSAI